MHPTCVADRLPSLPSVLPPRCTSLPLAAFVDSTRAGDSVPTAPGSCPLAGALGPSPSLVLGRWLRRADALRADLARCVGCPARAAAGGVFKGPPEGCIGLEGGVAAVDPGVEPLPISLRFMSSYKRLARWPVREALSSTGLRWIAARGPRGVCEVGEREEGGMGATQQLVRSKVRRELVSSTPPAASSFWQ